MQLTKAALWISLAALLTACGDGQDTTQAPAPDSPAGQRLASGPSCLADFADKPCELLTAARVKAAYPALPEGVETAENPGLNSCEYSWPGDRTRLVKVSTFEVETPIPNRVAINWIRKKDADRALEQFQLTYRNLSDEEKAEAVAAVEAQLAKRAEDLPEDQRALASGLGKSLIEASHFEPVEGVGSAAVWDGGALVNSLKVLDRDTEFGIEVDISADPAQNRALAIAVAREVMAACP